MSVPQRLYEMDRAPGKSDSTHRLSYRVGDTWLDRSTGKTYVMQDGAKCAAIWSPLAQVVKDAEDSARPAEKPAVQIPVASEPLSQSRPAVKKAARKTSKKKSS